MMSSLKSTCYGLLIAALLLGVGCTDHLPPGDEDWDLEDHADVTDVDEPDAIEEGIPDTGEEKLGDQPTGCDEALEGTRCHRPGKELVSRCAVGKWECDGDGDIMECEPYLRPVPQLCNGLDDDCSGRVDDESSTLENEDFSDLDIPDEYYSRTCHASYVSCVCPRPDPGVSDHRGSGDTHQEEFDSFIEYWSSRNQEGCHCIHP